MAESLVELEELTALLKRPEGSLVGDDYTELVMRRASNVVRSTAEQPAWVGSDPVAPQELAPWRAREIALTLAKQAWEDRGNLQRRTAGPVSHTFFEGGLRGLELSKDDKEWLLRQRPGGGNNGMWILGHYGTNVAPARAADETPDGYSFARGDLNFAHGMDMRGPVDGNRW